MIKRVLFWLDNSRLFSLPMTLMSWVVVFVYSLKEGGNILNGVLALAGIAFAHLATNLFDDFIDYKVLSKNEEFLSGTVKSKCSYIKDNSATLSELLRVVIIYCGVALIIGIILTIRCGLPVAGLALIGGLITLSYAKLSMVGLSEIAVGTAFGPLLFEGVYYVMTEKFSLQVFILSVAVVIFTVGLLYVHTLLDFDGDLCAHKKTLCCIIGSKDKALNFLLILYLVGYLMCFVLVFISGSLWYLLPVVTLPLSLVLYVLMKMYNNDKNFVPEIKWWNYPLDNWDKILKEGTESFYLRLFQARNLMMWFSILMIASVWLSN